jgi:hypothetical protein
MTNIESRWDVLQVFRETTLATRDQSPDGTIINLLQQASMQVHFGAVALSGSDILPSPDDPVLAAAYTAFDTGGFEKTLSIKRFAPNFPGHLLFSDYCSQLGQGALSKDYLRYEKKHAVPPITYVRSVIDNLPLLGSDYVSGTLLLGGLEHRIRIRDGRHRFYSVLLARKDLRERLTLLGDEVRSDDYDCSVEQGKGIQHFVREGQATVNASNLANSLANYAFVVSNYGQIDNLETSPQIAPLN